jgi:hypothetical protein
MLLVAALLVLPLSGAQAGEPLRSAVAQPRTSGVWFPSGSLLLPQGFGTATLLPSGQVLIAGGDDFGGGAGDTTAAELYNPRTNSFTFTGSLTYATEQATATLLKSGQVLVVGGANDGFGTGLADLYNPATGTFTATGTMPDARVDHTATLLPDGRVLIAGGCNGAIFACTITTASAELYDPATGTFTPTGSMTTPRQYDTATLLRTGQVLLAGGAPCDACFPLASAELYDPATGTFTPTGSMTTPRAFHTATLLPSGQVLVAGGCTNLGGSCAPAYDGLASAELYDPATGRWTATGSMTMPRFNQGAALLPNRQVLIAGGANGTTTLGQALATAELYNPVTGRFTATVPMDTARENPLVVRLGYGGVLVAGSCFYVGGHCDPGIKTSGQVYWYR